MLALLVFNSRYASIQYKYATLPWKSIQMKSLIDINWFILYEQTTCDYPQKGKFD